MLTEHAWNLITVLIAVVAIIVLTWSDYRPVEAVTDAIESRQVAGR
jgi:uncharacterized membrane protein